MGKLTCWAFVEKVEPLRFHKPEWVGKRPFAVWNPADGLTLHFQTVELLTQVRDEMTRTIEEWRKHLDSANGEMHGDLGLNRDESEGRLTDFKALEADIREAIIEEWYGRKLRGAKSREEPQPGIYWVWFKQEWRLGKYDGQDWDIEGTTFSYRELPLGPRCPEKPTSVPALGGE